MGVAAYVCLCVSQTDRGALPCPLSCPVWECLAQRGTVLTASGPTAEAWGVQCQRWTKELLCSPCHWVLWDSHTGRDYQIRVVSPGSDIRPSMNALLSKLGVCTFLTVIIRMKRQRTRAFIFDSVVMCFLFIHARQNTTAVSIFSFLPATYLTLTHTSWPASYVGER